MLKTSDTKTDGIAAHASAAPARVWTERGTPAYRHINIALFLVGFATFSLIYCVQPVLPALAHDFHVGPAASSLALSLTTGFMAVAVAGAAAGSEVLGRRGVIFGSLCCAALLNMADTVLPGWHALLVARAAEGFALGGIPAVAMAYLAEEIHPKGLGLAMGLYIGGTAFGGMIGRIGMGALTELTSWRVAMGVIGAVDLAAALGFFVLLPASRNFTRRHRFDAAYHLDIWRQQLRHPALPLVFVTGFLAMGAFVTVYNYAAFYLSAPPYGLSPTEFSLVYAVFVFGIASSTIAGGLADRFGHSPVLICGILIATAGVALTLLHTLAGLVVGIAVLTIGFFTAHSVASGWVGTLADRGKGHAAALYLLAYYVGASTIGTLGGWVWSAGAWPAVVGFTGAIYVLALAVALRLKALTHSGAALPSR